MNPPALAVGSVNYNLERLMGMAEGSLQEAIMAIFRVSRLGSDIN